MQQLARLDVVGNDVAATVRRVAHRLSLLVITGAALACDGNNVARGVRIAHYSEAQSRVTFQRFIEAAGRNDSLALGAVASDTMRQRVLQDHKNGSRVGEYVAAASSSQIERVEVVLEGADLRFVYRVDGQPRNGRASVRFRDGRWQVVEFQLLVEY